MPQFYIPVGEVLKSEPKSQGIETPRKKKPREIAVITECCTGCAGSPACVPYCPVEDCIFDAIRRSAVGAKRRRRGAQSA